MRSFVFLFDDQTERNLAPTNTEDWITIVKWAAPSAKEKTVTYNFTVKYDDNPTATIPIVGNTVTLSLSQNVAWQFDPSLAYFRDLVNRGSV
jgi:hypothetical protein